MTGKEWTYKKKMAKAEKLKNEAKNIYEKIHNIEKEIEDLEFHLKELMGKKIIKIKMKIYLMKGR
ncbi:Hypothetical protein MPV1_53 [Marinitoga phage MPV1]